MSVNSLFKPNDYTVYAGEFIGPVVGPINISAIADSGVNPSNPEQIVIKALTTGTIGETHAKLEVVDNSGFTFGTPLGNALQGNKIVANPGGMLFSNETAGNIAVTTNTGDINILSAADGDITIGSISGDINIGGTTGSINLDNLPDADNTYGYVLLVNNLGKIARQILIGYSLSVAAIPLVGGSGPHVFSPFIVPVTGYRRGLLVPDLSDGQIIPPETGEYSITASVTLAAGTIGNLVTLKFEQTVGNVPIDESEFTLEDVGGGVGGGVVQLAGSYTLNGGISYQYVVTPGVNNVTVVTYPATIFTGSLII